MTDAASADAARSSVPEVPLAFEPTSETHRFYCDPAEDASLPVAFSRAPRGVAGGEDLFAPSRALLESVTLGEYLEARRSEAPERFVTTLDVSTTADEALRVLARASAHAAPLVDKERRAFLGFLDVDDLLSGFFARLERAIPPPSMPPNPAAAAAHAERRAETASGERSRSSPSLKKKHARAFTESFVREEGRRRWIAGVDKTSLAEAVQAFATSTLSDLRRARAGAEDGRMVYRGARDASLLELVRSGFLRPVAKPAAFAETKKNTDAREADDSRASVPARSPTVADVPARATTCHRVATYRLRLDAEWRSDAMVVDAIVSQWDVCRFLRDRVAKRNDDARLRSASSLGSLGSPADAFRASLRELGMVSDASGDDSHQRVVTVTLRTSVLEAFSKMRAAGVSCAGVTCEAYDGESAGPLVGVITANDFRVAFCGPGQSRRLPDWVAGELLGSVDAFLYRIRTVRLFWERRTVRGGIKDGERDSPCATPATTYLRSVTRDASLFEALDALVTDATHHVFVVDAFHGRAVRVITPADVLRAVAAPGRAAIGWRYRERSDAEDPPLESASREKKTKAGDEKTFADGVRRAGGCLGALEISDDFKKRDDERNGVPVGFAGRFDDEM